MSVTTLLGILAGTLIILWGICLLQATSKGK